MMRPDPLKPLIVAGWITAFLASPIGAILGIVLIAKDRIGQGLAMLLVSAAVASALFIGFAMQDRNAERDAASATATAAAERTALAKDKAASRVANAETSATKVATLRGHTVSNVSCRKGSGFIGCKTKTNHGVFWATVEPNGQGHTYNVTSFERW